MKLMMSKEERISKKDINAVLKQLKDNEISKGACIRQLFAGGLSVKDISTITTIRYNHVYNVCRAEILKNNLESEVSTEREGGTKKDRILELLSQGKTITEVSKELGCLYNQVWQIAKANGYTKKQQAALVEVQG